jgi:hypothetical protein
MTRQQLEHLIRASAATVDVRDVVVIGSQSILASFPNPPAELTVSMEADVYPKDAPQRSIVIDGAIGELSLFHETFGYYAHGVDDRTAVLPDGWEQRLVRLRNENTMGATGWCLEPHDLAISKLAAGREKDRRFVEVMLRDHLINAATVRSRLVATPQMPSPLRESVLAWLDSLQD